MPEASRSEFKEKFSAKNFALSDVEDDASGQLNRGGINFVTNTISNLPKSRKPSFWEVIYSFVLLAKASLVALRTLL